MCVEKVGAGAFEEDLETWNRRRGHTISHAYLKIDHGGYKVVEISVGFREAAQAKGDKGKDSVDPSACPDTVEKLKTYRIRSEKAITT